jgi:hypothetical protein
MASIVVLAPVPPSRSPAVRHGDALVRLLRRSGIRRRHRVRVLWPIPENIDALVRVADLTIHLISADPDDGDGYRAAVEHPGLVVLPDLDLRPVVEELARARDPAGRTARDEAEAAEGGPPAWFAHVARRARGVVVPEEAARTRLLDAGCLTPIFVAPLDDRGAASLRRAVESTLALVGNPAEWTLGRWAAALADVGVGQAEVSSEGYGLRFVEALDELGRSDVGGAGGR